MSYLTINELKEALKNATTIAQRQEILKQLYKKQKPSADSAKATARRAA